MISFLNHIVDDLDLSSAMSLKDKCFVFPSRRASLYFIDLLHKKNIHQTAWAPKVYSIEEFVQESCPTLTVVDPIQLLFKLYQIYRKLGSTMEFDVFQQWGQTLLNDFDELDRYMVDASLLYKNLNQFEELENILGPNEDAIAALKSFQQVIETSEKSDLFKEFKNTWEFIGKVYFAFKAELMALHWAYNGMCYRQLAEDLKNENIKLPYEEVVFAGFNAISKSEEIIINSLIERDVATVYFDADRYYLNDDKQEAGLFQRRYKKRYRNNSRVHWVITDGFNQAKNIEIIGVEQKTSQAKAIAQLINEKDWQGANTAIVLADENLLPPLLYSLPDNFESVNITMGYPVVISSYSNLLSSYLLYQASITTSSQGKQQFVQRDAFRNLVEQPLLRPFIDSKIMALCNGKSTYLAFEQIRNRLSDSDPNILPFLQLALEPIIALKNTLDGAGSLLLKLYFNGLESNATSALDTGVVQKLVTFLENLKEFIEDINLNLDIKSVERIVRDAVKKLTVPFSGEPLAELQVMGFLESRSLDFNNIVVSSVNEDLLPASSSGNTYIPFGIRKAFKMPTFLEHNSLYAYHFFRLLQRATNVTLIYSTKLSITGAGERSRYILQLLHNFGKNHPYINLLERTMVPPVPAINGEPEITILKNKDVLAQIDAHFASFNHENPLTPTVLLDYVSCSLKYYFRRILKIKEPDEPLDKIDARVFGNLYHDVIESIYKPWIGKLLTKEAILKLVKDELPKSLAVAFDHYDNDLGEVVFTKQVIQNLIRISLINDADIAPLTIIDLESKKLPLSYLLTINEKIAVPIGGKIDRLDKIKIDENDIYRVIDYKTGHFELKPAKKYGKLIADEEYIDAYFNNPKYKSGFQLLFYSLIQKRTHPSRNLNGGIIGIKNVNEGVSYLRQTASPLEENLINNFEARLSKMIDEILNPSIPFTQTEDIKECTYCSFRRICKKSS